MMEQSREGHWLFLIETDDRPGAAAALAMVFSGRGIQIESFIGYGDPAYSAGRDTGIIVITFKAFRHRMEMVQRVLQRLEVVHTVDCSDYDADESLVKTATVALNRWDEAVENQLRDFDLDLHSPRQGASHPIAILSGRPAEVDRAVSTLNERTWLASATYAFLPPGPTVEKS